MLVIQLMHYLEAAGCATSIQLALGATVHQSANYFWGFQVLTTVETADARLPRVLMVISRIHRTQPRVSVTLIMLY